MTREQVQAIVDILNRHLALDRDAITKIFVTRHHCTTTFERPDHILTRGDATISALGVFNDIMDQMTTLRYRVGIEYDFEANIINKFFFVETKEVEEKDEADPDSRS